MTMDMQQILVLYKRFPPYAGDEYIRKNTAAFRFSVFEHCVAGAKVLTNQHEMLINHSPQLQIQWNGSKMTCALAYKCLDVSAVSSRPAHPEDVLVRTVLFPTSHMSTESVTNCTIEIAPAREVLLCQVVE